MKDQYLFSPPRPLSFCRRQPGVDFSPQSIHFNHVGQRRERRTNWLAGICIYSTQQNVTDGLGGDLCGLLAKQTDEGNLSCRSCSAEQGLPRPLLLALSVTCHAAVGRDEMSQHRRRQKSCKDRDGRDDSLMWRTVLYYLWVLFSPPIFGVHLIRWDQKTNKHTFSYFLNTY